MPTASRPTFMRRFAGTLRPPPGPDLADMGTAFALDHSLDQAPDDGRATATPSARAGTTPVSPWRLWLAAKLGG